MPPDGPAPPRGWPDGFGAGPQERDSLLRISRAVFIEPRRIHAMAWESGSARAVLETMESGGLGKTARSKVAAPTAGMRERLRAAAARLVTPADPEYPKAVLDLSDPPAALFVRGRTLSVPRPALAIVGSRAASPTGKEIAAVIGRAAAAEGVTVISGAAYGIDAAGHEGALSVGGPAVAVLGSGIDVPYPADHEGLIESVANVGSVVSEYPPGTGARPKHFPARNRILVALASAVLVVEGATRSGSLISAEFAQQLGREVLAVPGTVTHALSEVPNSLIRDGATLVRGPSDVIEAVTGFEGYADAAGRASVDGEQRRILDALGGAPVTAEAVAASTGIPLGRTLAALSALELGGLARERGGRYERTMLSAGR